MNDIMDEFVELPMVPTFRPMADRLLAPLCRILHEEGYPFMEILFRPPDQALDTFRVLQDQPDRHLVRLGAGTILTRSIADQVLPLKPDFLVSPAFSRKVLSAAVKAGVPYIPSVRTFQDVQDVLEAFEEEGRTLKALKLCPVQGLDREYVTILSGCYPNIVFCPTGPLTLENYIYWMSCPCIGPAMSSQLIPQTDIESSNYDAIRKRLRLIRELYKESKCRHQ
jgi:2-dehydro-3-deoxyphosphogluconate aldolase/(4S)-4-hydroxy-2-oxoglutarate aldolase